ncbi:hypothetical protein B296_00027809 [Ensete ventricosum]|uniref:Uncharacterized protein n=1 Tax=Ensete ventricosum TaxID=4639 RepID=A0A426Z5F0_ENSVE|nr:hypothetical protein B296_00027809 [Ensete ventricosum]
MSGTPHRSLGLGFVEVVRARPSIPPLGSLASLLVAASPPPTDLHVVKHGFEGGHRPDPEAHDQSPSLQEAIRQANVPKVCVLGFWIWLHVVVHGPLNRLCCFRDSSLASAESKEKLAKLYEVKGPNTVFDLIYDMVENAKKYEPKYRLIRNGLATKVEKSRNQVKQRKNRVKKVGGVKKVS